jgi:molybdenum ABC transporter molybdate-binding protein
MGGVRLAVLAAAILLGSGERAAEPSPPLIVYAAGSTAGVLQAVLARYTAETGEAVVLKTGPAGTMLERIEAGEPADLFVSANMAHPRRLTAEGKATATMLFARNRLCASALPSLGLTSANLLDRLLDPKVRVGTSQPGADPGGDYAWAMFERADKLRPGAGALLRGKAKVGGGGQGSQASGPRATAAQGMAVRGVDVVIGYCSTNSTAPDPSIVKVPVPSNLSGPVDYGMVALTRTPDPARRMAAERLALFLQGSEAQSILPGYGFLPARVIS